MNINKMFGRRNIVAIVLAAIFLLATTWSSAATVEQQTLVHLDRIRAIKADADEKTIEGYNKQMDEAWQFFNANKKTVVPIMRKELSLELQENNPNNLLLLDIGYFLRQQEAAADKELSKKALFALDTTSAIIRRNQQELFHFAYAVAPDQDPEILPFLDKAFLRGKVTAFVPQHALTLDETLVCVFLYGIHGQDAERHLSSLLSDRTLAPKIIEILVWIGSPDSVPAVKAAMMASRDYATFARATAFMMRVGGPQGRAAMLAINPKDFDAKSQEYYAKVAKDIEASSYEALRKQFNGAPSTAAIGDNELKKRLSAMYANYGKDDETSPGAILDSGLSRDYLISQLARIRDRMFYRLSDEALSDIETTNAILNTLHYRSQ